MVIIEGIFLLLVAILDLMVVLGLVALLPNLGDLGLAVLLLGAIAFYLLATIWTLENIASLFRCA